MYLSHFETYLVTPPPPPCTSYMFVLSTLNSVL